MVDLAQEGGTKDDILGDVDDQLERPGCVLVSWCEVLSPPEKHIEDEPS